MIKLGSNYLIVYVEKYTYYTYIVVSKEDFKDNKDKPHIRIGDGLYKSALCEVALGEGETIKDAVQDFISNTTKSYAKDKGKEIELKDLIKELRKYNFFEI